MSDHEQPVGVPCIDYRYNPKKREWQISLSPEKEFVSYRAVLAAFAAAVPDDLAEAGKLADWLRDKGPWNVEANGQPHEIVRALLARIAAQEAQIKGLEAERNEVYEEGRDAAADFIFANLAKAVGGEDYTPCDGTETWEGDVAGTVWQILKAGSVWDDEDGRVAKLSDATALAAMTKERDELRQKVQAMHRRAQKAEGLSQRSMFHGVGAARNRRAPKQEGRDG